MVVLAGDGCTCLESFLCVPVQTLLVLVGKDVGIACVQGEDHQNAVV